MMHKKNNECMGYLSQLVLSTISVLIMFCCVVSGDESKQKHSNAVEQLMRSKDQAETKEEKDYYDFCIRYEQLRNDDIKELTKLRNDLLEFGRKTPQNLYRTRALTLVGDISKETFNDNTSAQEYYTEAQGIFLQNPDWSTSQHYLSYIGIRMGDSFATELRYEEAVNVWEDTFLKHPQNVFSQQIPSKVDRTNELYLPPKEAWTKTMSFYDKALEAVGQSDFRPRLEIERIHFTLKVIRSIPFYTKTLVNDIDSLLDRYQPGDNKSVDKVREGFLHMKKLLQKEDEFLLLEDVENVITDSISEKSLPEPDSTTVTVETTRKEVLEKDPNLKEEVELQDKSELMENKGNYFTLLIGVAIVSIIALIAVKLLKLIRR